MKNTKQLFVVLALSTASLIPTAALTSAAPASLAIPLAATDKPASAEVRYRGWRQGGYRGHRRYGRRHRGINPGAAIIGGVAAAIIAGAIREGRAQDDDYERCAAEFRSFDPASGTYVTYGGERRVCPYLS